MLGEHHNSLAREFPEFKEKIHQFKEENAHFARLVNSYEAIEKEIYRIEEQIETPSDEYTEEKKKERLQLKDEIYTMLQQFN
jgi:hypothetical protein